MFLPFEALHPEQNKAMETLQRNSVVFLTGPAGCAKTHTAMHYALSAVLDPDDPIKKIHLSRPAVVMGKELGFTPGDISEKLSVFLTAPVSIYKKILEHDPKQIAKVQRLIESLSIGHCRGRTIERSVLIIDEAQNCTGEEVLSLCTRVGKLGKVIFCGDAAQADLRYSPLREAAECLNGIRVKRESVGWFEFSMDACVRSGLTQAIIKKSEGAPWLN